MRMKKRILKFSSNHPTLYNVVFYVLFGLLLTATSFLPYIYRAVVYPVFYEKEEKTGVIEAVYIQNNEVASKHNRSDMPIYYFSINDTMVRVTPSSFREYKRGDVFEYYQYAKDDEVIGDSREYMLGWGLSMLIIYILLAAVSWVYFTAETADDIGRQTRKRGTFHNLILIFVIISVILACVGYARFFYHFIYLFT